MIKCPKCQFETAEIKITGPVLIASGIVEIGEDGQLTAVGAFKALQTVQIGAELTAPGFVFCCVRCKHEGLPSTFPVLYTCILTGKGTETFADTVFGRLPVVPERLNDALAYFTLARAAWEVPITTNEVY